MHTQKYGWQLEVLVARSDHDCKKVDHQWPVTEQKQQYCSIAVLQQQYCKKVDQWPVTEQKQQWSAA